MNGWEVLISMFIAIVLWLIAVPIVGRRAARKHGIKAAMKRHPAGRDLNNGR